tara:strand:- start:241 stop:348 length:108 start_codon:yes stop_codon:yes gene_type:complete
MNSLAPYQVEAITLIVFLVWLWILIFGSEPPDGFT